ncbi:alpha beta hydrolase fold protein [Pochonia chlamydosporia 170]|uniref:Alpha beta hydrolase fold protein n=1 Tax=Pochonia chlamydosporia 170 TaxID=1380566 RepID=A0A179FVI5_METCM|nr:alpha beta hydrolase fold protein [Pochonia chlamydosporia 170]OAQ69248.1 alpha beta hydrolase fold protein [Pochonia chlamydosporia 170]
MFETFQPFTVTTQETPERVSISGIRSGNADSGLPPLLLLHGFPQSRHIWHRVASHLIAKYTVVIPDLRGYGESSKPTDVSAYAKSAMARDCVVVMNELGFKESFFVCAHDRGARVTHKLCVDYPERVQKAILLDICPTLAMYSVKDPAFAMSYFHWFLLIQKEPLPETLLLACPRRFAELFMGGRQKRGLDIFDEQCFEHYVKNLSDPATVHAMCQDYRASATLDLEEARADLRRGRLVRSPLRVLWANSGVMETCFETIKEWQAVVETGVEVSGHGIVSGHYIPEDAPNDVVSHILDFLV